MNNTKKLGLLGGVVALLAAGAASATTTTVDYSGIASSMSTEVGLALAAAVGLVGLTMAPRIGIKTFKSFAK